MKQHETLPTVKVAIQAGCSYRQIDYWIRTEAIPATVDMITPGSGRYRRVPVWYVPRLRLLGNVSKLFGTRSGPPIEMLRHLFDNYELGMMEYSGVVLSWEVEEDTKPKLVG